VTDDGPHDHPVFARTWAAVGSGVAGWRDREALVTGLSGRVVEVGAGDGLNFEHYPASVTELIAVEPEPRLRARAAERAQARGGMTLSVVDGTAEALPAADGSVDAVVACLVLCSVTDQAVALAEMRRVLRPGGQLRFHEHVIAHHRAGAAVQRALDRTGVWPHLAAGCHLARDTESAIRAAGFTIAELRRFGLGVGPLSVPHVGGRATR
jgi:SAM-dependent methyltransferase